MQLENTEYYKIAKEEKRLSYIMQIVPSIFLGVILLFLVISDEDLVMVSLFIVISMLGTAFVYLIVLLRPIISFRKKKSAKVLFDKIGYERLLIRYRFLVSNRKEFLKLSILFLIITVVILSINAQINTTNDLMLRTRTENFLIGLTGIFVILLYSNQVTIVRSTRWNDSYYFQCVSCFQTISCHSSLSIEEKSSLIQAGLEFYNTYLRLEIKRHLSNLEVFYLKILSNSDQSMNNIINNINESLKNENKLSFLRYLTNLYDESRPDFLGKDIISKKLLEILSIALGPIITVLIFLISFVLGIKPSAP